MRLLFVDSSRNGWGTEQHLVSMARSLAMAGHQVAAVVKRGGQVEGLLTDSGVQLYPTAFRGGVDPRGIATIARAMARHSPEWLIANRSQLYWTLWTMSRAAGVRVALFRHLPYISNWSRRCVVPRLADRFFVVSKYARETLIDAGAPNCVRVLYNPIDTGRFRPDSTARSELRRRLRLPHNAVLGGFVGRMEHGKGVHELQAALLQLQSHLPQLHFVWIGDGPERDVLQRVLGTGSHRRHHSFVGWTSTVERWYAALDFLVAPGVSAETFGRVVAESQACGVPVIASGVGGLREAFDPGFTGLAIEPGNQPQLRHAITTLCADLGLRLRFGAAGRRYVRQNFAADRIAESFVEQLQHAKGAAPEHNPQSDTAG